MQLAFIQAALSEKGYHEFNRPFELNIVGIRANSIIPNRFDDHIVVYYKNQAGTWQFHEFAATTDPGTYWLENPLNPQGTAILKEGQYMHSHMIGLHRNKYMAIVQQRAMTIIRDYDRNAVLDFNNGREETGVFGINIHHAQETGTTRQVDKFSAGCQVFANAADFQVFMQLCGRHRGLYGNFFTYTLVDDRAIARALKKN